MSISHVPELCVLRSARTRRPCAGLQSFVLVLDSIDNPPLVLPKLPRPPLQPLLGLSALLSSSLRHRLLYTPSDSSHSRWAMYVPCGTLPTSSLTPCPSFCLQGAKAQQKRERNAGKAANAAKSQTKTNQAAMNIVCTVCRQAFVSPSIRQLAASTP